MRKNKIKTMKAFKDRKWSRIDYNKGKRMILTEHYSPVNNEEWMHIIKKLEEELNKNNEKRN